MAYGRAPPNLMPDTAHQGEPLNVSTCQHLPGKCDLDNMDQYYDVKLARPSVEELSEERVAKDAMHLSRLYRDMGVLGGVYIESDDGKQMWRLAKRDKDTGESEEMVFTATGMLAHMDLPPITRDDSFDNTIKALKEIQRTGEREFHQGQLQEWTPSKFQGHDAIEMSN
ncbi:hypothetical protein EV421DRAFT_1736443 [Armillaria borealis]|uniref:Uncharacterized protein n=1 Tax=Armillaria borealis TaxID=47425 RepID=A0AA39JHF8_9AGAR|nr:hypothetical protein EV421DRAFT_1736443 [Armillaria borealis]